MSDVKVSEAERMAAEIDGDRYGDVAAELRRLAAEVEALREALRIVAEWELPPSGRTWESGNPMSYETAFGSNGARDYMRALARSAMAAIDAAKQEASNG